MATKKAVKKAVKKVTPFWHAAIDRAHRTGSFSEQEKEKAVKWQTCACGNQDAFIPRDADGTPLDADLEILGSDFMEAVEHDDASSAGTILARIEKRAAKVMKDVMSTIQVALDKNATEAKRQRAAKKLNDLYRNSSY